jgi:hypothetical protein
MRPIRTPAASFAEPRQVETMTLSRRESIGWRSAELQLCVLLFRRFTQSRSSALRNKRTAMDYNSLSAAAMGRRAARMAGNRPPTIPINTAHTAPCTSNCGVTLKANATALKV